MTVASALLGCIAVYAQLGAIIHLRNLPSIVVTLGMSFVWGGLAVLLLPAPGGTSPEWIRWLMTSKPPLVPMAIVASVVIAAVAHWLVMRSAMGERAWLPVQTCRINCGPGGRWRSSPRR